MNNIKKRYFILLSLVLIVAFVFSSCQSNAPTSDISQLNSTDENFNNSNLSAESSDFSGELTVAYDRDDSLNPLTYKKEINSIIIPLLYDSLISLDENFVPTFVIAESVICEGSYCIIQLKNNLKFSDGSPITSQDVVYSINSYMSASSVLKSKVSNILTINSKSPTNVEIMLKTPDKLFINLLDLPIIKNQTGNDKIPIGSGRFIYSSDDKGEFLGKNSFNPIISSAKVNRINLQSLPDNDAVIYGVKSGTIDYTLVTPSKVSDYNTISSHSTCVSNNLIYLGTNNEKGPLIDVVLRNAIYSVLNRNEMVSSGYGGFAVSSYFPFNPFYSDFTVSDFKPPNSKPDEIKQTLKDNGYLESATDPYLLKDDKSVTLKLIVNNENTYKLLTSKIIKKQLEQIGINIDTEQFEFNEFKNKITTGDYDLYLGEINIPANMDLSVFFSDNKLIPNKDSFSATIDSFNNYKNKSDTLDSFLTSFSTEIPFIPLYFSKGVVLFSGNITSKLKPTIYDCFYNISEWE